MSLFNIPIKVARILEKTQRDFLWDGPREKKRIHLVNWETVNFLTEKGGLDIGNLVEGNWSLLTKMWWRFWEERVSLWRENQN